MPKLQRNQVSRSAVRPQRQKPSHVSRGGPNPAAIDNEYHRKILEAIASGRPITQRSLASELGVALGLTNLLIHRLVSKGYVKMAGFSARHVRYLMTAAGWEALATATRLSLQNTVSLYTQTREQIRDTLATVSASCLPDEQGRKSIVFYGAGDVAEIAYVSLQTTDLTLVGVVDDRKSGQFFGLPIHSSEELTAEALAGERFVRIVVTSIPHADKIKASLARRCVPADRVHCL